VQPSPNLTSLKHNLIQDGYTFCAEQIAKWKDGRIEASAGSTEEETLESILSNRLSSIREEAGETCVQELQRHNSPLIMTLCGSKGSKINISQMVACVGQQIVGGSRIANGFVNRTLPHFEVDARGPQAKGFVANSFYTGLTPTEFFFHTMGGREGLVDTAVKVGCNFFGFYFVLGCVCVCVCVYVCVCSCVYVQSFCA
jgi:DNA-directed RNA polymerase III subunit RPC1